MSAQLTIANVAPAPAAAAPKPDKPARDSWDKFDLLSKPIVAALTAAIVAIIGYFTQSTLTDLSAKNQDARLYTELLSRREDSESSLRKDMFKEVMSGFFDQIESKPDAKTVEGKGTVSSREAAADAIRDRISKKMLKLEMLSLNFGDSLSLGPLFKELANDVERTLERNGQTIVDWKVDSSLFQERLQSLAKRVADAQLSAIYPRAVKLDLPEIPTESVLLGSDGKPTQEWSHTINASDDQNPNVVVLEGVKRIFELKFRNADYAHKTIDVSLNIFELREIAADKTSRDQPVAMERVAQMAFSLDFYNFPLIDNTRLSNNQRVAFVLDEFDEKTIRVSGVVFPGLYASQRDKPFLNEAIRELNKQSSANKRL